MQKDAPGEAAHGQRELAAASVHHRAEPPVPGLDAGLAQHRHAISAQLDRNFARFGLPADAVATERELSIEIDSSDAVVGHSSPGTRVRARLFHPGGRARGVHVYLHGGGWVAGSIDDQVNVAAARHIAAGGQVAVLCVGYRLAPEHPWPSAIEDTRATIRYLQRRGEDLGIAPHSISLGGDSAGANIAAAYCLCEAAVPLKTLVLGVPVLDLTGATMQAHEPGLDLGAALELVRMYCADLVQPADPLASPLKAEDFTAFPLTYLVAAGQDPLRHDAVAFAGQLRRAGIECQLSLVPHAFHDSALLTGSWAPARNWLVGIIAHLRAAHQD